MPETDAKREIARRIGDALTAGGVPPESRARELSKRYGVSREAARKWLNGESTPERTRLATMAADCGVNVEWIWTGQGPKLATGLTVPQRVVADDAGHGYQPARLRTLSIPSQPAEDGGMSGLAVPAWILERAGVTEDSGRVFFAPDDAMAYAIQRGAMVILDTRKTAVQSGGVFVIEVGGAYLLRRLLALPTGVRVQADNAANPAYAAFDVASPDALKIVGRVVWSESTWA